MDSSSPIRSFVHSVMGGQLLPSIDMNLASQGIDASLLDVHASVHMVKKGFDKPVPVDSGIIDNEKLGSKLGSHVQVTN